MKHTGKRFPVAAALLLLLCVSAHAQVYKVVDQNGNVTYTDQAPIDGSEPMDLPDLSVVETEPVQPLPGAGEETSDDEAANGGMTPREMRRAYRDFRITSPAPEETFWGTGNAVVVNWSSSEALQPDMTVRLLVDGEPRRDVAQSGPVALTLDRGTHTVQAELRDGRGRRIVTTDAVTFYIKQQSRLINPGGGGR